MINVDQEDRAAFEEDCIDGATTLEACLSNLDKYGVHVIRNFLDLAIVANLNKEFDKVYSEEFSWNDARNDARRNIIVSQPYEDEMPTLARVVRTPLFSSLARSFIGPRAVYPSRITFFRSTPDFPVNHESVPLHLHFDRLRCLRFFIYLTDVDVECAPFSVVPGTVGAIRKYHRDALRRTEDYRDVQNLLSASSSDKFEITAPAGSVIIFDTEIAHSGKVILSDRERRVLRIDAEWPISINKKRVMRFRAKAMNAILGSYRTPERI